MPEALPFAQAALLGCSTITGAGAVLNTATVSPGDSVAVIGCGGVGLNVLSGALLAQAGTIIAIDTQPAKLELAREFGATHVVDASQGDPVQAVREITGGGAKHVFEVVGIEATTLQAVRMTATGGTAYLVGLHRPGSTTTLDMMADVLAPQRTIVGVYMGSADIRVDIPRYAELYLDGELNLDSLISRQIKLSEINDGFDEMRRGSAARSVITAWD